MTSMGRVAMTLVARTTSHWPSPPSELVEDHLEAAGQGDQRAVAQKDQRPHEVGPARPETSRSSLLNPAGSPADSSSRSACYPPLWCWSRGWPCWPPGGQVAGCGPATRPDHNDRFAIRWGCRAHLATPSAFLKTGADSSVPGSADVGAGRRPARRVGTEPDAGRRAANPHTARLGG